MHTDEQHEPAEADPDPAPEGGLRARLRRFFAGAAARVRDALGADSLGPEGTQEAETEVADLPARRDGGTPEPGDGELTASRSNGWLRISDGDTYIESDTWKEPKR
jgi:hypothetical protein